MKLSSIVLAGSLVLNMLLGGLLAGQWTSDWLHSEPSFHSWLAETGLNAHQQERLAIAMQGAREASYGQRKDETSALRKEIIAVLTAPEFDEAAYRELSARMLAVRAETRALMSDQIAQIAATLSQQERAGLAHVIQRYAKERDRCRSGM